MEAQVYSPAVSEASQEVDPDKRLRVGIVGAGFMGEVHARAVRASGHHLTAVTSGSPERAASDARRLGAGRGVDSAEDLIASHDIDVIHICTPNHLHVPLSRLALKHGKNVICEKPLAMDETEAAALVAEAKAAKLTAAVPFVYRYYPTVREARQRLAAGDAGTLRLVHGSYLQDWLSTTEDHNWRVDPELGGVSRAFADIGVHWCDIVEFVTGQRIAALAARLLTAVPGRLSDGAVKAVDTEDAATIIFETDGGAIGSLVVSQVSPGRKNRLWFSLDGSQTSMEFNQELPETLWIGGRDRSTHVARGTSAMSPQAEAFSVLPAGHPQGYQDCFNSFIQDVYATIAGEERPGLPTFSDGLRAAVITAAVLRSAADGSWVEVH